MKIRISGRLGRLGVVLSPIAALLAAWMASAHLEWPSESGECYETSSDPSDRVWTVYHILDCAKLRDRMHTFGNPSAQKYRGTTLFNVAQLTDEEFREAAIKFKELRDIRLNEVNESRAKYCLQVFLISMAALAALWAMLLGVRWVWKGSS